MQRSLSDRLVRSRLQWEGHVDRMADDRLPKRAAELHVDDRRRRARPRLRWVACVKGYMRKAGEEEGRLEEEHKRQRMVEKSIK